MWHITSILLGKRNACRKPIHAFPPIRHSRLLFWPTISPICPENIPTIARIDHNWWAVSPTIPLPQCLSEGTQPLPSHAHLMLSFSQLHSRNKTFIALLLQLAWIVRNKKSSLSSSSYLPVSNLSAVKT